MNNTERFVPPKSVVGCAPIDSRLWFISFTVATTLQIGFHEFTSRVLSKFDWCLLFFWDSTNKIDFCNSFSFLDFLQNVVSERSMVIIYDLVKFRVLCMARGQRRSDCLFHCFAAGSIHYFISNVHSRHVYTLPSYCSSVEDIELEWLFSTDSTIKVLLLMIFCEGERTIHFWLDIGRIQSVNYSECSLDSLKNNRNREECLNIQIICITNR